MDIGERRGDHFLAAVVAVPADLGDQDARPAASACLKASIIARLFSARFD